jgi:hypothetical protein
MFFFIAPSLTIFFIFNLAIQFFQVIENDDAVEFVFIDAYFRI